MTFFKFSSNDKFHNILEAHPEINFKIYDGKIYYNNDVRTTGSFVNNIGNISTGRIDLFENNIDRSSTSRIYPFITKNGSKNSFKTQTTSSFNSFLYGDIMTGSYPVSAGISIDRIVAGANRINTNALRNAFNSYITLSPHFAYSSSLGNKATQEIKIISIPSIFFGSSIEKGSVSCKFYLTGTLIAELVDEKQNGELRQKLPQDSNSGSVAGCCLYNDGFIILTGSWSLHPSHTERYDIYAPGSPISPRWLDFGTTGSSTPADLTNVASSSFQIQFNGEQKIPVLTMLCHAPKGLLNYSNNPTFIQYNQTGSIVPLSSSVHFHEKNDLEIKNVVKSNFIEPTGSFVKTTYISKIGIFDKNKNLIAIAKLSSPIRKTENIDLTFKLKYDF